MVYYDNYRGVPMVYYIMITGGVPMVYYDNYRGCPYGILR